MELHRDNRISEKNKTTSKPIFLIFFFFFIIFLSFCSSIKSSVIPDNSRHSSSAKAAHSNLQHYQEDDQKLKLKRRGLGGPGSSPPRCASKCGKCTPCTAVHVPVPVPPGNPVKAEYYPEAWRCKCRNKLYMP